MRTASPVLGRSYGGGGLGGSSAWSGRIAAAVRRACGLHPHLHAHTHTYTPASTHTPRPRPVPPLPPQGIEGHGFYGKCVVPVIENTARECELTDRLRQAIADYPQANAVLVRRHGEAKRGGGRGGWGWGGVGWRCGS